MRRCARAGGPSPRFARLAARALVAPLAALLACSTASPETEVKEALARLRAASLPAPAGVTLAALRFSDVVVEVDGPRARVLAVVEAEGRAGEDGPAVAYVGREAFEMERCRAERWCLAGLPALGGVLAALRAAPRDPGARVLAWQVRVERGRATAGEDFEAGGRRLRVVRELRSDGAAWRVAAPP